MILRNYASQKSTDVSSSITDVFLEVLTLEVILAPRETPICCHHYITSTEIYHRSRQLK